MPLFPAPASPSQRPRVQRALVLAGVLIGHLALFGLLLIGKGSGPPTRPAGQAVQIALLPATRLPSTTAPPPALPSRIAALTVPRFALSLADAFDLDGTVAPSGNCATLDAVSTALLADPVALGAIRAAPPETRSIADAMVMWDIGWTPAAHSPDGPLGAVRQRVEQTLMGVDDACLDETIAGPRFVAIPNGDKTMFLVFGTGQWNWRQLMFGPDSDEIVAGLIDSLSSGLPF